MAGPQNSSDPNVSGDVIISTSGHALEQPLGNEIADSGGSLQNLAQLNWLVENCPGFNPHIFGHAAEYICRNKDIVLAAITHAQEKEKAEE